MKNIDPKAPNERGYLCEFQKRRLADPSLVNLSQFLQKNVEKELRCAKTSSSIEKSYMEKKLTLKMIVKDPDITTKLFGFHCDSKTICSACDSDHASNNTADIMGLIYDDEVLSKKYNLVCGYNINGNIEVKLMYRFNDLQPSQKNAIFKGFIHAVFSFGGIWTDYVERTDCPILGYDRITIDKRDIVFPDNGLISSNYIYDKIIDEYNFQVYNYPILYRDNAARIRLMENIYWHYQSIPFGRRTIEKCIVFLAQDFQNLDKIDGETEKEYHERVIENIKQLMRSRVDIPELDDFFGRPSAFQKKSSHHRPANYRSYRNRVGPGVWKGENNLYKKNIDSDGVIRICFAPWLVKSLHICEVVYSELGNLYSAHEFLSPGLMLESSYNIPSQLRAYVRDNPNPSHSQKINPEDPFDSAIKMNILARNRKKKNKQREEEEELVRIDKEKEERDEGLKNFRNTFLNV